jgi:hypothetical protein
MMCENVAKADVGFVTTVLTNWQGCRTAAPDHSASPACFVAEQAVLSRASFQALSAEI